MNEPKPGTTLYGRSGERYEFGSVAEGDHWYVHPMMEAPRWDGEVDEYAAPHAIRMDKRFLHTQPPKPVLVKEISDAQEQLRELREKVREKTREFAEFEKSEQARLDRIRRHEQLARLDDFLEEKITHVVTISSMEFKIDEIARYSTDPEDRYDRVPAGESKLKLLTLYGTTKGNLNWKFSHYRDGSGNTDYEVIPCFSSEEARTALQAHIDAVVEAWRGGGDAGRPLQTAQNAATRYGLSFPDDAVEVIRQGKIAMHERSVENARQTLADAVSRLVEVRDNG